MSDGTDLTYTSAANDSSYKRAQQRSQRTSEAAPPSGGYAPSGAIAGGLGHAGRQAAQRTAGEHAAKAQTHLVRAQAEAKSAEIERDFSAAVQNEWTLDPQRLFETFITWHACITRAEARSKESHEFSYKGNAIDFTPTHHPLYVDQSLEEGEDPTKLAAFYNHKSVAFVYGELVSASTNSTEPVEFVPTSHKLHYLRTSNSRRGDRVLLALPGDPNLTGKVAKLNGVRQVVDNEWMHALHLYKYAQYDASDIDVRQCKLIRSKVTGREAFEVLYDSSLYRAIREKRGSLGGYDIEAEYERQTAEHQRSHPTRAGTVPSHVRDVPAEYVNKIREVLKKSCDHVRMFDASQDLSMVVRSAHPGSSLESTDHSRLETLSADSPERAAWANERVFYEVTMRIVYMLNDPINKRKEIQAHAPRAVAVPDEFEEISGARLTDYFANMS